MAAITGIAGSVTIPTAVAGGQTGLIYRWSADIEREIIEVTTFDDAGSARVKAGGMHQLTGSCEAYFDSAILPLLAGTSGIETADAPATSGDFVLQTKTGDTYTFGGLVTSIRVATEKVGGCIVTLNFQSDDDVVAAA